MRRVEARVAVDAGAEVADGVQEPGGVRSRADLARGGRGVEQLSAHRHQAVEKPGVQGLEAGLVGLQRRGESVLGDQEVDVVSGGRLDFGIGAGSRPSLPMARREYEANGLPYHHFAHSAGDLAETCTVIRRLWTSEQPFDFDGSYLHLTGAFCNPKPVQQPRPPVLIGGRSAQTLRAAAEHADLRNMPGGDIDDAARRSAMLDRFRTEIGRDPASITRSIILPASYHHPGNTRKATAGAIDAGFPHIILSPPAPYPEKSRSGSPTSSSQMTVLARTASRTHRAGRATGSRSGSGQDPVDHHPVISPPVPLPGISGHQRRQPLPFLIGQIVPIQAIIHPP